MIIHHDAGRLRIRCGYSPDLVQLIKCAPDGRKWDPKTKEWILPASIDNLKFCINELRADAPELKAMLADMERPLEHGNGRKIEWQVKPFKHQVEGLDLILSNDHVALFWEQGVGKTLPAIKATEHRLQTGAIKRALVVCPKTVISAWLKEFAKYSSIVPAVIGGKDRDGIQQRATVAIINYDLLRMMTLGAWDMVIFDESQYIKGHNTQRSKAAYALAKTAKFRVLLTGTPVAKDAGDLFGQFRVLDESIFGPSFYSFRAKYFVNMGRNFPDWQIRPVATQEIRAKVALRSQRLRKADVLDLPEKLYQVRTIEMGKEQARIYREIEKQLLTEIEDASTGEGVTVTVPYLITRMMRLNQICSGFLHHKTETGTDRTFTLDNPKLFELKQIVDDYMAGDESNQVVIWAVFLHDVRAIKALYPGAMVIDGSKSIVERTEAIECFQAGQLADGTPARIIVLQQQAGAVGITLTAAHLSIFYSRNYSLLDRVQAEDRLHRIGQRNAVIYVDLVMEHSIEQDIVAALEEKRLVASYLQGDIEDLVLARFKQRSTSGKTAER